MTSPKEMILAFDPTLPLERAHTIPSSWYGDAAIYEAERQTAFAHSWLPVGRAELVSSPGSFLTAEIAGEPMLVVRDEAGTLRAFHNVCRHRAAPVMTECHGTATRLRCRYHGWTYDLAGRLRGVPEFDGVADFAREDNGLVPMAVDLWGPFVWIRSLPIEISLLEFLSPLPELLGGQEIEQLIHVATRDYDIACNWKVYVDNYLDGGYHIHTVHPSLGGIIDYSRYRTEIAPFTSTQVGPLQPGDAASASLSQVRSGENAYYSWVFPNVMFNVYAGYMDANRVLPLGPDRCRVVFDYWFAETQGEETRRRIAESIAVSHEIQLEDVGICEEVQRGLGSRSFDTGRYSVRREGAVHAFHCLLAKSLRRWSTAPET